MRKKPASPEQRPDVFKFHLSRRRSVKSPKSTKQLDSEASSSHQEPHDSFSSSSEQWTPGRPLAHARRLKSAKRTSKNSYAQEDTAHSGGNASDPAVALAAAAVAAAAAAASGKVDKVQKRGDMYKSSPQAHEQLGPRVREAQYGSLRRTRSRASHAQHVPALGSTQDPQDDVPLSHLAQPSGTQGTLQELCSRVNAHAMSQSPLMGRLQAASTSLKLISPPAGVSGSLASLRQPLAQKVRSPVLERRQLAGRTPRAPVSDNPSLSGPAIVSKSQTRQQQAPLGLEKGSTHPDPDDASPSHLATGSSRQTRQQQAAFRLKIGCARTDATPDVEGSQCEEPCLHEPSEGPLLGHGHDDRQLHEAVHAANTNEHGLHQHEANSAGNLMVCPREQSDSGGPIKGMLLGDAGKANAASCPADPNTHLGSSLTHSCCVDAGLSGETSRRDEETLTCGIAVSPAEAVKRKRCSSEGSSPNQEAGDCCKATAAVTPVEVVKRKRGRPRKLPCPSALDGLPGKTVIPGRTGTTTGLQSMPTSPGWTLVAKGGASDDRDAAPSGCDASGPRRSSRKSRMQGSKQPQHEGSFAPAELSSQPSAQSDSDGSALRRSSRQSLAKPLLPHISRLATSSLAEILPQQQDPPLKRRHGDWDNAYRADEQGSVHDSALQYSSGLRVAAKVAVSRNGCLDQGPIQPAALKVAANRALSRKGPFDQGRQSDSGSDGARCLKRQKVAPRPKASQPRKSQPKATVKKWGLIPWPHDKPLNFESFFASLPPVLSADPSAEQNPGNQVQTL